MVGDLGGPIHCPGGSGGVGLHDGRFLWVSVYFHSRAPMSLGGACASPREVSFGGQKGAAVAKYGERGVVAWSRAWSRACGRTGQGLAVFRTARSRGIPFAYRFPS